MVEITAPGQRFVCFHLASCVGQMRGFRMPGPVKYAASLLGRASDELRLPLAPIAEASKQKVRAALTKAGLLN